MGTDKRDRQRAGREARATAEQRATKRANTRRTIVRLAVIAAVVLGGLFAWTALTGDGDNDTTETAAEDTGTTTTAGESTTTTAAGPTEAVFTYGGTPCPPVEGAGTAQLEFPDGFAQCIDPAKTYSATLETSEGTVKVTLDTTRTPGTANNFVALARHGYYDGTELFRTDPSIGIIQGGSPHTNDPSDPGPGYSLPDEGGEFDWSVEGGKGPFTYAPGQIVMARSSGPNGGGAQFFLTADDAVSALDAQGTYVVFGQVTEGLEVLQTILGLHEADPTGQIPGGSPSRDVTLESVTITES